MTVCTYSIDNKRFVVWLWVIIAVVVVISTVFIVIVALIRVNIIGIRITTDQDHFIHVQRFKVNFRHPTDSTRSCTKQLMSENFVFSE